METIEKISALLTLICLPVAAFEYLNSWSSLIECGFTPSKECVEIVDGLFDYYVVNA